ncbi:hypothetical protein GCM10010275_10890 [Streptomyces litmocidini]|nr:hypothetical protein GCM10010275_10890 [Streptomyces litmocidini]
MPVLEVVRKPVTPAPTSLLPPGYAIGLAVVAASAASTPPKAGAAYAGAASVVAPSVTARTAVTAPASRRRVEWTRGTGIPPGDIRRTMRLTG